MLEPVSLRSASNYASFFVVSSSSEVTTSNCFAHSGICVVVIRHLEISLLNSGINSTTVEGLDIYDAYGNKSTDGALSPKNN